ncbi:hypothetical protein ARMGADRAFT_589190 [Armillaria gallica]|uniref:Uncharacterized protein n=1 Tax=Armillaria gallica TaxID=47427 RepID=A0A2H3DU95_ARMGA|nr:hypothetical protein ARMGADRAFT_589190 [Armillaria gallica]
MQATRLLASPPPFKTERPGSVSNSATSSDRIYRTNIPYHSIIVKPFEEDSVGCCLLLSRYVFDLVLIRGHVATTEPSAILLNIVLETHGWATSCLNYESDLKVPKFEKKIFQLEATEVEKEQGTSPFSLLSLLSVIFDESHSIMINQSTFLHHLYKVVRR